MLGQLRLRRCVRTALRRQSSTAATEHTAARYRTALGARQLGPLTRGADLRAALVSSEQRWFALAMPTNVDPAAENTDAARFRALIDRCGGSAPRRLRFASFD